MDYDTFIATIGAKYRIDLFKLKYLEATLKWMAIPARWTIDKERCDLEHKSGDWSIPIVPENIKDVLEWLR